jgi:biotin synthase-related radical SAM superfamily protein
VDNSILDRTSGNLDHIYHELNRLNDNLKYTDDRTLKLIAMNKLRDTRSASASSITYLQAHASATTSVSRQHRHAETFTTTCS